MSAKGLVSAVTFLIAVAETSALAGAPEEVQGIDPPLAAIRVIDERCLDCHNRKRIDQARSERREIEGILRTMEKKGAAVSPKEREVIGHFWRQRPFRSNW